jgi:hypothetical protein
LVAGVIIKGAAVGCCTVGGVLVTMMLLFLPVVLRDELQCTSSMESNKHTNNIPLLIIRLLVII